VQGVAKCRLDDFSDDLEKTTKWGILCAQEFSFVEVLKLKSQYPEFSAAG
jgi:hypothetical protein